jgi:hypothetical protein
VKTTLFAFAFVVALSLSASAANSQKPAPSVHGAGNPDAVEQIHNNATPQAPLACSPCLFYGGDLNPSSPNAAGMSDENTFLILGGGYTYGAVNIPAGTTASVTGLLFNVQADAAFDPTTATYDIRSGVSEGDGGTDIATGSAAVSVAATDRTFLGVTEYTLSVTWSPAITLTPGEYWFNLNPQCLNTLDGSCYVFRQFVSNSIGDINAHHGSWQPLHEMFLNSSFFGFTWANWCDSALGFNDQQCGKLSFGLIGTD